MDAMTSMPLQLPPPGIKVLAHAKSIVRQTWDTHAFEAWYTGPALEHYRCHTVWAIKTRQARIVNQLVWFPTRNFPKLTSEDLLRATIEDLKVILMNPPTETYVGHMDQTQRRVLINLQELLHSNVNPPEKSSKPTDASVLGVPKDIPQQQPQSPPSTAGDHDPLLGVPIDNQESTPRRSNRSSTPPQRYEPAMAAVNKDTGNLAEYKELQKSSDGTRWELAFCKEWGRLFQGYKSRIEGHDVIGTETCHLIHKHEIPDHKKATYIRTVLTTENKRQTPTEFGAQPEATSLTSQETSPPDQQT